ncbi:hypothetical protein B5S31_g1090 [[Candida] boidinii]|nr:hypothetical protein B5S31_g1090 [[Candida] boidinii]
MSRVSEKDILDFYQLSTVDPTDWLRDSTSSEVSVPLTADEFNEIPTESYLRLLSEAIGTEVDALTDANHVNRSSNTEDPLGFHQSILDELIDKDVISDSRNPQKYKFMIDSKAFNPKLFLSALHQDKSFKDLQRSLSYLDSEMKEKNVQLQKIVETEFTHFIKGKSNLDKVFKQFSQTNLLESNEDEYTTSKLKLRRRRSSLMDDINSADKEPTHIQTITNSVNEANTSSAMLLNPIMECTAKEASVRAAIKFVEENSFVFDLRKKLGIHLETNDHDALYKEYKRGKNNYVKTMKSASDAHKIILDKVWEEVETIMTSYKKLLWEKLGHVHIENIGNISLISNTSDTNFLFLINRILELGATENPIIEFLNLQFDYILKDIDEGINHLELIRFVRAKENTRNAYKTSNSNSKTPRKMSSTTATETDDLALSKLSAAPLKYLYSLLINSSDPLVEYSKHSDLPIILELWGLLMSYIDELMSEVLGKKIIKYCQICDYFTSGKFIEERSLINSKKSKSSNPYIEFEDEEIIKIKEQCTTLVYKVCNRLITLFTCSDKELFDSTLTTKERKSQLTTDDKESKLVKDYSNPDSYGFIPQNANALSTLYYALRIKETVAKELRNISSLELYWSNSDTVVETLSATYKKMNECLISGILAVLVSDFRRIHSIENWAISTTYPGSTNMPLFILRFYEAFLPKLNQVVFNINTASSTVTVDGKSKNSIIPKYPSEITLKSVQTQFVHSLKVLLDNLLNNVLASSASDKQRQDLFFLRTISNVDVLKSKVFVQIFSIYDNFFKSSLSQSSDDIYATLDDIKITLFERYIAVYKPEITAIVQKGLRSEDWFHKSEPNGASTYTMELLNFFIMLSSKLQLLKVSPSTTRKIQTILQKHMVSKIMDCMREIPHFSTAGIFQVCVDFKFMSEVLRNTLDDESLRQISSVCKKFTSKAGTSSLDDNINKVVNSCLLASKLDMDCFV